MLGLHAPDGAERLCRGIDSCDRAREIVVRKDGAGSGGVVEPGAACWVGISGASGVMGREAQQLVSDAFEVEHSRRFRFSHFSTGRFIIINDYSYSRM